MFQFAKYLVIIFFSASLDCYASINLDSLKNQVNDEKVDISQKQNALEELVKHYSEVQLDSARHFGQHLIQNAIFSQKDEFLFDAYYRNAYVELLKASSKKSIEFSTIALQVAEKMQDLESISRAYNVLAMAYESIYDYKRAQDYYLKSIGMAERLGDRNIIVVYLNNIGVFYRGIGNFEKAKEYFYKSLQITEGLGLRELAAMVKHNLGQCLIALRDYELGMLYLKEALTYYEQTENIQAIAQVTNAFGVGYAEQGDIVLSQFYFHKALNFSKRINNKKLLATVYEGIIENLLAQNNDDSANFYLNKAWEINGSLNNKNGLAKCSFFYYIFHKRDNNFEKGLMYHELYNLYSDSISNQEIRNELYKEQVNFDLERQQFSDSVAFTNLRKLDVIKQKSTEERYMVIYKAAFIIVLLIFIFFRIYARQLKNKNELERTALLSQIDLLKGDKGRESFDQVSEIDQELINNKLNIKLNDTDWSILKALFHEPALTNKELSAKVHISYEGVRSSLKKMYVQFDIDKSAKNKKASLVLKSIEFSTN